MQRYWNYTRLNLLADGTYSAEPAPSATITVYQVGTLTLASIFADPVGTPLANPFTAAPDGYFFFYAVEGQYDVRISGGDILTPYTWGAIAINSPPYNVLDFGAMGDNTTDDSTAILAAIAAAVAAGGGRVYLPTGKYFIDLTTIVVPSRVVLEGDGPQATTLRGLSDVNPLVHLTGSDSGVRRLTIQGPGTNIGGGGHGIVADLLATRQTIEYVEVYDIDGIGMTTAFLHSAIRFCHIHDCTNEGINLSGGSGYNDVGNNTIHDLPYAGIGCNGSYNDIHDNEIYNCGGGLADVNDWSGIAIVYAPGATFFADGNHVHDNRLHDNHACGVHLAGSSQTGGAEPFHPYGNVIANNVCWNHTTAPANGMLPAGIGVYHGGSATTIIGNLCYNNRYNFAFGGWNDGVAGRDAKGLIVVGNTSLAAVLDGYFFTDNDLSVGAGNGCAQQVEITGNQDALAGRDGFRFTSPTLTLTQYHVHHNLVRSPAGYGYNVTDPARFTAYTFADNTAITPGLGATNGITVTTPDAGTLIGTTLAANVVSSSLTSLGVLLAFNLNGPAVFGKENTQWVFDQAGGPFRLGIVKKGGLSPQLVAAAGSPIIFAVSDNADLSTPVAGQTLTELGRLELLRMTLTKPLKLKSYTVATLPAGSAGDTVVVTDATAPVYGNALVGGGGVTVKGFYTGAAWVAG